MSTEILANLPQGVCVLTEAGELGLHDAQHGLRIDASLTRILAGHVRGYLQAYRSAPHADDRRVAIVYKPRHARPWGPLTFSLEDFALRSLYPVGGRHDSSLTAFQQKNREMSFYRGMEVMLEFQRHPQNQNRSFCPVLYANPATLAERSSARAALPDSDPETTAVLDVLNLAAGLTAGNHCGEALAALAEWLHHQLIRKHLRRERRFTLVEESLAGTVESVDDPFGPIERDKRLLRELTLPTVDARRLHDTDRVESIERWLRLPHQVMEPWRLRQFAQFQDLDDQHLAELAQRSLIYTAPAGTHLLDRNLGDAWNFYLLEGSVMLTPADGLTLRVDSGSEQASYPIAYLKPRIYSVDTLTPVSFLWVHDQLLQALANSQSATA